MYVRTATLLTATCVLGLSEPLAAQSGEAMIGRLPLIMSAPAGKMLAGIEQVRVVFDLTSKLADSSAIANRVGLLLQQNGIRTADTTSFGAIVQVGCVATDNAPDREVIAYTCWTSVRQLVARYEQPQFSALAVVWESTRRVGSIRRDGLREKLHRTIEETIEEFLNAWYSANPKR